MYNKQTMKKKPLKFAEIAYYIKKDLMLKNLNVKKKLLLFLIKELEVNFLSIIKNLKKVLEGDK